jgi:hypothetical protein
MRCRVENTHYRPNLPFAAMINPAVSMDMVRSAADAPGRKSRDN